MKVTLQVRGIYIELRKKARIQAVKEGKTMGEFISGLIKRSCGILKGEK